MLPEKRWYVYCQKDSKQALMYGPCLREDAEGMVPFIRSAMGRLDLYSHFYGFGIAEWKDENSALPTGKLNNLHRGG